MGAAGSVLSNSILSLIAQEASWAAQERVFIGEGLPTVPKYLYNRMVAWKFVDLAEHCKVESFILPNPTAMLS